MHELNKCKHCVSVTMCICSLSDEPVCISSFYHSFSDCFWRKTQTRLTMAYIVESFQESLLCYPKLQLIVQSSLRLISRIKYFGLDLIASYAPIKALMHYIHWYGIWFIYFKVHIVLVCRVCPTKHPLCLAN